MIKREDFTEEIVNSIIEILNRGKHVEIKIEQGKVVIIEIKRRVKIKG